MKLFKAEHIGVVYTRDGVKTTLFNNVSLSLAAGGIYDLGGPSGSGKSTFLRACALMIERTSGEFYLEGKGTAHYAATEWRQKVSLVPQVSALVSGSVRDNLVLPWKLKVRSAETAPTDKTLRTLLDRAELDDIELGRDISQLSGGQIARVALLRVFATKPRVLLLDEVDAALDDDSAHAIGRLTYHLVGEELACLRVRHRPADGFARGTFTLDKGCLSYKEQSSEGIDR